MDRGGWVDDGRMDDELMDGDDGEWIMEDDGWMVDGAVGGLMDGWMMEYDGWIEGREDQWIDRWWGSDG